MTLIEILIVLAVIGIIAGGVALVAVPHYLKSLITTTHTNAIELHSAVELWRAGHAGECPTVDRLKTDGVIGPTSKTTDAWNHPYKIRCEDAAVSVASAVVLVQWPYLATRLHLVPLHATDWGIAVLVAGVACLPLLIPRARGGVKS